MLAQKEAFPLHDQLANLLAQIEDHSSQRSILKITPEDFLKARLLLLAVKEVREGNSLKKTVARVLAENPHLRPWAENLLASDGLSLLWTAHLIMQGHLSHSLPG